jgi:hypothetical protein
MIIFYFCFFCERTERDKGRLTCHQHFGCNSLRRGMPIIIIISSFSFLPFYLLLLYTYTFCEFLVFPLFFSFPVFISLHTYKSLWRRVDSSSRPSVYTTTTQHTPKRKKEKNKMRGTRKKKVLRRSALIVTPCSTASELFFFRVVIRYHHHIL